jgi:hypothetical protein
LPNIKAAAWAEAKDMVVIKVKGRRGNKALVNLIKDILIIIMIIMDGLVIDLNHITKVHIKDIIIVILTMVIMDIGILGTVGTVTIQDTHNLETTGIMRDIMANCTSSLMMG